MLTDIVEGLITGDISAGLNAINEAIDRGTDPRQFLGEILDSLRAVLLLRVGGNEELLNLGPEALKEMRRHAEGDAVSLGQLVRAIKRFGEAGQAMRYSSRPQIPFELAFVEAALDISGVGDERSPGGALLPTRERGAQIKAEIKEADTDSWAPSAESKVDSQAKGSGEPGTARVDPKQQAQATPAAASDTGGAGAQESEREAGHLTIEWVRGHWDSVLLKLKPHSQQVRALLNSAYPISVEGNVVTLGCEAAFHRDKLRDSKKRALIEKVLSQVLGAETQVTCVVDSHIRQSLRAGESLQPRPAGRSAAPASLSHTPSGDNAVDERQQLLNHPAVKELEKRGGVVSQVSIQGDQEVGG